MSRLLVLQIPHSIVDVITNSSSELFVIPKEKGIEVVKEYLKNVIQKFNDGEIEIKEKYKFGQWNDLNYFSAFKDPFLVSSIEDVEGLNRIYDYASYIAYDQYIKLWRLQEKSRQEIMNDIEKFDLDQQIVQARKEIKEEFNKFIGDGKIFVVTADDNCIPSEIINYIAKDLNCKAIPL
jgi:hypothetical protein